MRTTARATLVVAFAGLTACQLPYTGGAKTVQPAELGAGWLRAAPTPVVVQKRETDCGLAALAMVAGTWGRHWDLDDLAHRLHPGDHGVKLGALRDIARDRGLDAYAVKASVDDLAHELGSGRPVVLGLVLPFDQGHNLNHYEVAIAIHPQDGAVITIDPASGEWKQRSRAVLDIEWKAGGYAALVVVGDKQRTGMLASPRWPSLSSTTPPSSSASMSPMH